MANTHSPESKTQLGPLFGVDFPSESPIATVVMLHGIGLGPWMFDPWIETFRAWKLRVITLALPGHDPDHPGASESVTLRSSADAVAAALATLSGPVVLLGHSMGALIAQMVASRPEAQALRGLVLLCPMLPGQVKLLPNRSQLAHLLPMLPVALGRAVHPSLASYRALGMSKMEPATAAEAYAKSVPWPAKLTRDLLVRPVIEPTALTMPVLVAIGLHDKVLPWQKTRVLGDLYEAVVWRYDDLGHTPTMEPGGLRMARDIAKWCAEPTRPQVIESEGFGPAEGVGHLLRRARRGELMKKRSAYGQKKAAR